MEWFANDICLITHARNNMQNKVNLLRRIAIQIGFKVKANKTKLMTRKMSQDSQLPLQAGADRGPIYAGGGGTRKENSSSCLNI